MEIMQFVLGLYVGLLIGLCLRSIMHKLDFKLTEYSSNGSKTKNHR